VPEVKTSITPPIHATAKIPVHNPGVKKPAIAEQPATKISRQARINSTIGFIQSLFCHHSKNCAVKFFIYKIKK